MSLSGLVEARDIAARLSGSLSPGARFVMLGLTVPWNLAVRCGSCNGRKGGYVPPARDVVGLVA